MRRNLISHLYQLKITKALDGRGSTDSWSNTYNFESDLEIDAPDLRTACMQLVANEKLGHYQDVFFLTAYLRRLVHTPTESGAGGFVSISLTGNGARVNPGPLMPLNYVLVCKRGAAYGRSGRVEYRGCLAFADVDLTQGGSFKLKPAAGLTGGVYGHAAMVGAMNVAPTGVRMVMADDPYSFTDVARPIVNFGFSEMSTRQTKVKRHSAEYNQYVGARQEVSALKKQVRDILKGTVASAVDPDFAPALESAGARVVTILKGVAPKYAMKIVQQEALKALPGGPSE